MGAPEELRAELRGLATKRQVTRCALLRDRPARSLEHRMTVRALKSTAQRIQALAGEAAELRAELEGPVAAVAPWLLELPGVGPISAAQVLVSWSHAGRLRSEGAFAAVAGVNPIPASSGQVTRHRLNRSGDRQLNRALHTIVLARLRDDSQTRACAARRQAEGKSIRDIRRCLKRVIARQLFKLLERYERSTVELIRIAETAGELPEPIDHHDRSGRGTTAAGVFAWGVLVWSCRTRRRTILTMTELLSTAEAARILGVSRGRVVELATSDPEFPPSQPSPAGGRAWPRAAVESWAASHPERGPLHRGPSVPEVGGRSPEVWKVANLAGEEAQARNHTWIGPDHLLAALVHPDCPGAARAVLASLGVTAESLRQARGRSFVDPFEPGSGWKKVSPAFQLVLERANLEAVLLADAEVTSEHVLLALASQWAAQARHTTVPPTGDLDPAAVRRRVLDVTEGVAVPPPPAPKPPLDPEEAMGRVAPGLELAPTPDGKDPRRRMPWGSRIFVDAEGTPIKRADGQALRQYFIDRDGNPVLTRDGQPVHTVVDEHGREVLAEDGRPRVVPVEIPEGSRLEPNARST